MRAPGRVVLVALIAAACGCSSSETSNASREDNRRSDDQRRAAGSSCADKTERLAARLRPLADDPPKLLSLPRDIDPIESSRGTEIGERGPVVIILRDGSVRFQGERLASTEEDLPAQLDIERRVLQARSEWKEPMPLYLWIDREAPRRKIAEVLAAVPAGFEGRVVVVGPKPKRDPRTAELTEDPRLAKLERQLSDADAPEKAVLLSELIEESIGMCTPLVEVFGNVASRPASEKGVYIASAAPRAIRECGCTPVNLEYLEFALVEILGGSSRPQRWIPAAQYARGR